MVQSCPYRATSCIYWLIFSIHVISDSTLLHPANSNNNTLEIAIAVIATWIDVCTTIDNRMDGKEGELKCTPQTKKRRTKSENNHNNKKWFVASVLSLSSASPSVPAECKCASIWTSCPPLYFLLVFFFHIRWSIPMFSFAFLLYNFRFAFHCMFSFLNQPNSVLSLTKQMSLFTNAKLRKSWEIFS